MGRSFLSTRQGVNIIADRWERASKKYKCGKRVVRMAKMYSSEGFMGCNDGMESVLFSAMMEILKHQDNSSDCHEEKTACHRDILPPTSRRGASAKVLYR